MNEGLYPRYVGIANGKGPSGILKQLKSVDLDAADLGQKVGAANLPRQTVPAGAKNLDFRNQIIDSLQESGHTVLVLEPLVLVVTPVVRVSLVNEPAESCPPRHPVLPVRPALHSHTSVNRQCTRRRGHPKSGN